MEALQAGEDGDDVARLQLRRPGRPRRRPCFENLKIVIIIIIIIIINYYNNTIDYLCGSSFDAPAAHAVAPVSKDFESFIVIVK